MAFYFEIAIVYLVMAFSRLFLSAIYFNGRRIWGDADFEILQVRNPIEEIARVPRDIGSLGHQNSSPGWDGFWSIGES